MKSFYIGVKGILVKDNKVLLLKRIKDGTYYWDAPGGRIDEDEEMEDALQREIKEETGITQISVGNLLEIYKLHHSVENNHALLLVFFQITGDVKEVNLSREHEEYQWVDKDEIEDFLRKEEGHVNDGTKQAIRTVFSS